MRRHTIAQTGVSIKSQGHINLEEEGEGERKGWKEEGWGEEGKKERKEKGEKVGEGRWR